MKKILVILLAFCMLFGFASCSCGSKDNGNKEDVVAEGNEKADAKIKEQAKDMKDGEVKMVEDSEKVSFVSGVATITFYVKDNAVTGHEMMINYQSKDAAKTALSAMKTSSDYDRDEIESISQDGEYVIIKFTKAEYGGYTVDEVKQMAKTMESRLS